MHAADLAERQGARLRGVRPRPTPSPRWLGAGSTSLLRPRSPRSSCATLLLRSRTRERPLESHPSALESHQALMNHSRIDTTQVYLKALNRSKAMEAVRDLRWGSGFVENALKAHTGFEPVPPP